jgi:hypothetical protein
MSIPSSIRVLLLAVVAAVVLVTLAVVLSWLFFVFAVVAALTVLNLVYLPRAAARVHVPIVWLVMALLPLMLAGGALLSGLSGAAWGIGLWVAAIGVPRVVARDLVRRARRRLQPVAVYDIDATTSRAHPGVGRPLPPVAGRGRDGFGL